MGTVLDVFVSEDQCLLCIDIEVSSPLYGLAWIRISRGVTQRTRHLSEFAPEIEGRDTASKDGGTAVAQAQPEDLDLYSGRPIAFHPEILPPPSDRLHPVQPHSARPSGDRLHSTSHFQCTGKTHRNHVEIHTGERRWYSVVCCSGRHSHGPKMISK